MEREDSHNIARRLAVSGQGLGPKSMLLLLVLVLAATTTTTVRPLPPPSSGASGCDEGGALARRVSGCYDCSSGGGNPGRRQTDRNRRPGRHQRRPTKPQRSRPCVMRELLVSLGKETSLFRKLAVRRV